MLPQGGVLPGHDIIVIGASAGGVEALPTVLAQLPKALPAAVFVVLHIPPDVPSQLPAIIARRSEMPATHPKHRQKIEHGRIYIAPPDCHLRLEHDHVQLIHGPKENRHRPAVDPLFRSAATKFGPRVVGVILTGALDDGTQGLAAVKRCGGVAIVQNPKEAFMPSMPASALRYVKVNHVLSLPEIGPALVRLAKKPARRMTASDCAKAQKEVSIMEGDISLEEVQNRLGAPSGFICPECHGPLWETRHGALPHFRCHVGHAFSPESLLAGESDAVEAALWTAVRTLEGRAALLKRLATQSDQSKRNFSSGSFHRQAQEHRQQASLLRKLLRKPRAA
jgi:two-component system chemotaxis response regulator CheB